MLMFSMIFKCSALSVPDERYQQERGRVKLMLSIGLVWLLSLIHFTPVYVFKRPGIFRSINQSLFC